MQSDAVVFADLPHVQIELGVVTEIAQVEDSGWLLLTGGTSALFAERILHLGRVIVDAQVSQIGAGPVPELLIHNKIVLQAGLSDMDLAEVGEIGNSRFRGCRPQDFRNRENQNKHEHESGAVHARAELSSGCLRLESRSQSRW